ncbi:uncharacterized protein RCC_00912 [Ramularia collo-cygni]|uniref:Uncharacterized protein n=1 Tax=Ramularia collo-cygni TaxID=112498 RepID=A0A2D3UPS9_9PEZI|nr:uncharacterized protein RCC_00912 [Ramularia collo-cygni]CZT14995.1 uncharacterized protein RCC_00912 [Ramularia collo-cygni]
MSPKAKLCRHALPSSTFPPTTDRNSSNTAPRFFLRAPQLICPQDTSKLEVGNLAPFVVKLQLAHFFVTTDTTAPHPAPSRAKTPRTVEIPSRRAISGSVILLDTDIDLPSSPTRAFS